MVFSFIKRIFVLTLTIVLICALASPVFAEEPALKGIRISNTNLVMTAGQTITLFIRYTPASAAQPVTWSSDDTSVVSVDDYGTITAVGRGKARVNARTEGGLSTTCQITVRTEGQTVSADELLLGLSTMTVRVGQTNALWSTVLPKGSTDTVIQWSTSNPSIAGVDSDGAVTGIAPGSAVITATTTGGVSASCNVTVSGSASENAGNSTVSSSTRNSGEMLSSVSVRAAIRDAAGAAAKDSVATVSFKNKALLTSTALKAAGDAARKSGRDVLLRFTTTGENGKTQGTLTFDPLLAEGSSRDLNTGVHTGSTLVSRTTSRFQKNFSNELYVFELAQDGKYGFPAQVTVMLGLDGVKASGLRLYSYDYSKNKYSSLTASDLRVDKNGALRFTTERGGIIIASKGALKK